MGLADPQRVLQSYSFELSGGMAQRIMIGMAVAGRPQLVIADEPTSALDVSIQAQILKLLQQLSADFGSSLLLITHNLGIAAENCDRIAVMYAGRIVEVGPVEAVFGAPGHPYTIGLLPAITLGVVPTALTARTTRASILDVVHEDYVKAGLARGLSFNEALRKHVFRNAFIPVITVIGLQFGIYLGGSIVTETVFAWPGLGRLVVNAIYDRDYPVVQAAVFIYAIIVVLVNLAVDLFYAYIDPRVRL